MPLIGDVLKPFAKKVLMPLGLTAAPSAADTAIHKKMFGSGFTTLIIYIEEINDNMKIVNSLEESGIIIKGLNGIIKNVAKEQKVEFLEIILGTLGVTLLWNLLAGKGKIKAGKGTIRAGERF